MSTELITLTIEAKGEVISSNFPAFAEMVRSRLGEINRDLKTDEDFDQADAHAKAIAGAEASLKAAKDKALADAEQLHALFSQIDDLSGDLAAARLDLTKQIAKRKEEVRTELIEEALATFDIDPRDARNKYLTGLQTAIKGKRTVESMRTALRIYATTSQAVIGKTREVLDRFETAHGKELVMDRRELELQRPDAVEAELRRRREAKKAEDERKRLADVAAKARAEADQAKRDLAEANKPPLPPAAVPGEANSHRMPALAPLPCAAAESGHPVQECAAEWTRFAHLLMAAFAPVKAARAELKHPENIAKAQEFALAIGAAWKAANTKEAA